MSKKNTKNTVSASSTKGRKAMKKATPKTKVCCNCEQRLSVAEHFTKYARNKDGIANTCRTCKSEIRWERLYADAE